MVIKPVQDKRDLKDFIRVPALVQGDDPHFVPRLNFEMQDHLSPTNPYFDHAEHQFFVAYDGDAPVGRISAQVDRLAQKDGETTLGHFGCLEARDESILQALLTAAEAWLKERGAARVHGPYSLSINDETGLLVEGFDAPARMMMNHAPHWYGEALEKAGYAKAKDMFAYDLDLEVPLPRSLARRAEEIAKVGNIEERGVNMKSFDADLRTILDIFNDAWAENWGFVPMTEDEISYTATNMKMVIDPDLARMVFVDGQPAAMIVALPDLNEAIADLDGKLFPFGWIKLLWRLKVKRVKSVRVLLMGIQKSLQTGGFSSGLAALLIKSIRDHTRAKGYTRAEMSWVLEDNRPMNRLIVAGGGVEYKRYRVYQKDLT